MSVAISSTSIEAQFDKLPPHSIEAEMCVLASMMLDKEITGQVVEILGKRAEEIFYQPDHQLIYDLLVEMYIAGKALDPVLLREELRKRQQLEEIGGTAYLAQIVNSVPSAAHGAQYARVVREKSMLRSLIQASNQTLQDAYAPHEDVKSVVDRAEKRIFEIAQNEVGGTITPMNQLVHEAWDTLTKEGGHRGMETGFIDLDNLLNGLHAGEMLVIAARPSMGKTAFAMNIIEALSVDQGLPTAVFSLEMSRQQLVQRLLCSRARVDSQRLRKGMPSNEDIQQLASVVDNLAKSPIYIDDSPGLTILELRAKSRRLAREHGIKAIMIDYMQLMDNPGVESRQQQISEISRGIKAVARDLGVPVLALSQLNRAAEGRDGHRPRMSDLRESGSIEQDADVIMLLHREDYYHQSEPDFQPTNIAEVIVAKQRNGPTDTVKLTFVKESTRFENLSTMNAPY
jgi:replicative DNA helicase